MIFAYESIVNNLREKKLCPAQMNRNRFDLILGRSYWNCSTMDNVRCLNSAVSAVNKIILSNQCGAARKLFSDKVETALETHEIHLPFLCKR